MAELWGSTPITVLLTEYLLSFDRLLGRRAIRDGSGAAVPSSLDDRPFERLCVMYRLPFELSSIDALLVLRSVASS